MRNIHDKYIDDRLYDNDACIKKLLETNVN